jgi:S1-C subfamily serine protease
MKSLRVILLAVLLVGGFYYLSNRRPAPVALQHTSWAGPAKLETTEAASPQSFDAEEQTNITVYRKVLPAVVNITSKAVAFDFFYGEVPEQGQGSGFVLDRAGHILTNYHVVAGAQQLEVTLSNRSKYAARVVGIDRAHDLAVIQITAPGLQPATLGDSKSLVVGQKVFAIGNPFGLNGTMTRGIISSIRSVRGQESYIDEAIQTDAAINPGNSGGPLLNSRGEVIGINTMIASSVGQSSGVGFAVPINTAKAVLDDLVTLGRVRRPAMGIRSLPIGPEAAQRLGLASDSGVLIVQVVAGGAAERAGLRAGNQRVYIGNTPVMLGGDLIVAIDGDAIEDAFDIAHVMNKHRAGDTVRVTIYRGKQKMEVNVTLGELREQT